MNQNESPSTRTRLALVLGRMAALDTKIMAERLREPMTRPNRAAESTPAYGRRNRKKKPDAPQSSTSTPTPAS